MTIEALEYSILDCHEAGLAALAMEQADIPVDKTQGYYLDAASIYHQELSTRQTDPLFGGAV
jgi:hypothetical protein